MSICVCVSVCGSVYNTDQSKDERVLLIVAIIVVLDDHQYELFAAQVELLDFRPEEEANLRLALKDQHTGGRQA